MYQMNILQAKDIHIQTVILTYVPLLGVTIKDQKPAGHT